MKDGSGLVLRPDLLPAVGECFSLCKDWISVI